VRLFLYFFLFFFCNNISKAQFLGDEISCEITRKAIGKIYNFEFDQAKALVKPVLKKYDQHPASYLLQAQIIYWENYPVEGNKEATERYLQLLQKCKQAAETLLKTGKHQEEATFYLLSSYGSISRIYHYQKEYIKTVLEAKNAYAYLKEGFNYSEKNTDFLFTNGLYNYYRIQYPETHPQIKPIIYFFKSGGKEKGLIHLRNAGEKALFTKIEAQYYLANICLKYENRNAEALTITYKLHNQYPNNPLFLMRYVEALIANNQNEKAKVFNEKMAKASSPDQKMAYFVFKGHIDYRTGLFQEAENAFLKALSLNQSGSFTKDLKPMAHLILGKVYLKENNLTKAKIHINKALSEAEYTWVLQEAKELKAKF
jgi:hypothetical protein